MHNILFPAALILTGVLACLARLMKKETFDRIPDLLFSICYPCIILQSIAKTDFNHLIAENAYAIIFAIILTVLLLAVGLTIARFFKEDKKPVISFAMMINNSTYVGLPVAQLLFGARGVAFIIVFGVAQDLFTWTVGYRMFSGQKRAPSSQPPDKPQEKYRL